VHAHAREVVRLSVYANVNPWLTNATGNA
jgi:hypothetical protein